MKKMFQTIFLLSISLAFIFSSQATANAAKPDLIISHFSAPDSARAGQDKCSSAFGYIFSEL